MVECSIMGELLNSHTILIYTYYIIVFSHCNNKNHMINGKNYYDQNYYYGISHEFDLTT